MLWRRIQLMIINLRQYSVKMKKANPIMIQKKMPLIHRNN